MKKLFSPENRYPVLTMAGAFLLFGIFVWKCAHAAGTSATISWTAPAAYVDGTTLPASDIAKYTVAWGRSAAGPFTVGSVSVSKPTSGNAPTSVVVPNLVCGGFHFVVSVTTTGTAVYPNETSSNSNPVAYATGISCTPNPPGAVTAT